MNYFEMVKDGIIPVFIFGIVIGICITIAFMAMIALLGDDDIDKDKEP